MKRLPMLLASGCLLTAVNAQWLEKVIPLTSVSPYDACLNECNNCVYVSGWLSDDVSVIDADSAKVIALAPVGQRPTYVCANPDRNRVYALNSWDNTMTVINGYNHAPIESIGLNRSADNLFCNRHANRTYSLGIDFYFPSVAAFDGFSNNPTVYLPMPLWPSSFCTSTTSAKSYIAAGDTTVVISGDEIVGALRSPPHPSGVMCYNPLRNRVYNADGSVGCLDVIDCVTDSIVARCSLGLGLTYACYVPRFDRVCFTSFDGILAVYDCAADSVVARVSAGRPIGVSVCDSIAGRVYTLGGSSVFVFDVVGDSFIARIAVGATPCQLVWSATSRRVFVVNQGDNSVSVIRDTAVGVVECPKLQATSQKIPAAVVFKLPAGAVAFDAMGRRVLNPRPGVYFVREAQAQAQTQTVRKVVVQR